MARLRSLELLRALAALLVVLFHTQWTFAAQAGHLAFGGVFDAGHRGVDLFFVLSGFIIAHIHGADLGRPERLGGYAFSRITRIYPAVWIMSALAVALYALGFGGADKLAKLDPAALAASLLLLAQPGDALVNVTWTLTYEMFFYALFAIAILNRRLGITLLLLWQASIAAVALSGAELGFAGHYLRSLCLDFSVGLACAWWLRRPAGAVHPSLRWALLAAGIGSFVAGMALDGVLSWSGAFCTLGAGAIILALVRLEQAGKLQVPEVLVRLGGASYAIYLVHFSAIILLAALLRRAGVPVTDAVCLAVAAAGVMAGFAFDRLFDQPVQRWLRRLRGKAVAADPRVVEAARPPAAPGGARRPPRRATPEGLRPVAGRPMVQGARAG